METKKSTVILFLNILSKTNVSNLNIYDSAPRAEQMQGVSGSLKQLMEVQNEWQLTNQRNGNSQIEEPWLSPTCAGASLL